MQIRLKYILRAAAVLSAALMLCSCKGSGTPSPQKDSYEEPDYSGLFLRANFENQMIYFHSQTMKVCKESNPLREGADKTRNCYLAETAGGKWDIVYSDVFPHNFDFSQNPPRFTMKVLAPKAGAKVYFKIEPATLGGKNPPALEVQDVVTTKEGEWEDLEFDFSSMNPQSNLYSKIVICFDAGVESAGDEWYFDEIRIPDDDISGTSLFKRVSEDPLFPPDPAKVWMNTHFANAVIITPEDSRDGNWWMYARGGNNISGSQEQIGVFTQRAGSFNPLGPWTPYFKNPVIPVGDPGTFDCWRCLDPAPVVGPDGITYLFYKGRDNSGASRTGLAYSSNGYDFTRVEGGSGLKGGACDALYHDGNYYVFHGTAVDVFKDPLTLEGLQTYPTISAGGGPANFDNLVIWGTMVFRLKGVDKWFMTYQASACQWDFPDRFHVAVSDDLLHWTKVDNDQPFFTRGPRGTWDQCAMWYPEVIEWEDTLYLYYEGWGCKGWYGDRDGGYLQGLNSCVGVASCPKEDFLKWCGIK